MTNKQINTQIEAYKEIMDMIEELKAQAEAIKDSLKDHMIEEGTDEITTEEGHVVRYTNVLTTRFNTTEFKKFNLELYKAFTKQVESTRFSISY